MSQPDITTIFEEEQGWFWLWADAPLGETEWFGPYNTEGECYEAAREAQEE